jgi:hypothetical protein
LSRNNYAPVPQGYLTLPDYAERHKLDIVSLACAVRRGDMKGWLWTLREHRGVDPEIVKVIIVKAGAKAPDYVEKENPAKGGKEPRLGPYRKNPCTIITLSKALKVAPSTAQSYLRALGEKPASYRGKGEMAWQMLIAKCKAEQARRADFVRTLAGNGLSDMKPPEGYIGVPDAARRWGVGKSMVYRWLDDGRVPSKREGVRIFVKADAERPEIMPFQNQYTAKGQGA